MQESLGLWARVDGGSGDSPRIEPQALAHRLINEKVGLVLASSLDVFFRWLFDIYYLDQASIKFQ